MLGILYFLIFVIAWLFYRILGGNIKKNQVSARNIFDSNYYLYLCNSKLGMMWIFLSFLPGYNVTRCLTLCDVIMLHKPHPGNIVKEYAMKQVLEDLREAGFIK